MESADLEFDVDQFARAIEAADFTSAHRPMCDDYFVPLGKQAEVSVELSAPLQFLCAVCCWRLRTDDARAPFEPLWSPITPETVTEGQLDSIASVVASIADHDLRARLGDLLWLRRRCHKSARLAIDAYLASAEHLIASGGVVAERVRMRRGLQLASQLGRNSDVLEQALQRVLVVGENPAWTNCTASDALSLLAEYPGADAKRGYAAAIARVDAIRAEKPDALWERCFWDLAAKFASRLNDEAAARAALLEVAKSFEREAEAAPMCAIAYAHWEAALQAYRRVSDTQADRTRVHAKLLEAQEGMRGEMVPMDSGPIDLSDLVGAATRRVAGVSLTVALAELVLATRWQTKADVRRQAEENMAHFPMQQIFGSSQMGSTGKVAATAPSGMPHDDQVADERLFAEMCRHYKFFIGVVASGTIEPMRTELLKSHTVTLDDVAHLLRHSPYVPHGREAFWVIGIHAGLHGRFIESLHVLVPQVEHLLRDIFKRHGLIASAIDDDGIQQEFDLNRLLRSEDAETLLGEDLCFVLRVIFIERFGYNLRNEMSHGMLGPGAFFSDPAIYAWWLLLRLVAGSVADIILSEASEERSEPTDPPAEE
jgi:hypothetical protein